MVTIILFLLAFVVSFYSGHMRGRKIELELWAKAASNTVGPYLLSRISVEVQRLENLPKEERA
jgi:hypothetical protein